MLMPLFLLGLLLYFFVAWCVIRLVKPENPKKVWRWLWIITLVICTADHIAGYLYIRTWLLLTQGDPNVTIVDDAVALEFRDQAKHDGGSDSEDWILMNAFSGMVEHGYTRIELVRQDASNGVGYGQKAFELRLVQSNYGGECAAFNRLRSETQKVMLDTVAKNIADGNKAKCLSMKEISQLQARYLITRDSNELEPRNLFGITRSYRICVTDLKTQRIVNESRSVDFEGGWVKRTFWTGLDTGGTDFTTYRSYPFEDRNSEELSRWYETLYRPASHQTINK